MNAIKHVDTPRSRVAGVIATITQIAATSRAAVVQAMFVAPCYPIIPENSRVRQPTARCSNAGWRR